MANIKKLRSSGMEVFAVNADSFERDSRKERQPISKAGVRKIVKELLTAQHPNKTGQELANLVDEMLPRVMQAYGGPDALPPVTGTLASVARAVERKRVVKANRHRRRADKPLSRADREWMELTK